MAGWVKVPLATEVGLGPGDIVLARDPAPPQKGHSLLQSSKWTSDLFNTYCVVLYLILIRRAGTLSLLELAVWHLYSLIK